MSIPGSDLQGGTIFAPNATVALSGSGVTMTGFVEALDISLTGSNWVIQGGGGASP